MVDAINTIINNKLCKLRDIYVVNGSLSFRWSVDHDWLDGRRVDWFFGWFVVWLSVDIAHWLVANMVNDWSFDWSFGFGWFVGKNSLVGHWCTGRSVGSFFFWFVIFTKYMVVKLVS